MTWARKLSGVLSAKRLLGMLRYLAVFGLARGTLFFAPLVLASLLPATDYGLFEWAYATAMLLATLAALGTPNLVPLVLLGTPPPGVSMKGIRLHQLAVAALFGTGAAVAASTGFPSASQAALLAAVLVLQSLRSTELRSNGKADASLLVDTALLGCMMLAAAAMFLARPELATAATLGAAVACLFGLLLPLLRDVRAGEAFAAWWPTLWAGQALMLTGLLATLVTSSGRLGMGWLADPELTATYSVLARGAALPIVAHQVIMVAGFRRAFVDERDALERTLLTVLAVVAASATGFWLVAPSLSFVLGPAFAIAAAAHRSDLLWLLIQSVLWSGIALNDLMNTRFNTAAKVLRVSVPTFLLLALCALFVLLRLGISLSMFVRVHGALMLAFYVAQACVMRVAGIQMTRVWCFAIGAYLALALLAFVV